jgi:aryl-alcohol dehydrogenase-like predicted oxidoreductase
MSDHKRSIPLGKTGPAVFPIALGCMGMSGVYGAVDDTESVATIRHAIASGVTLLDTGDFYGMGHNEMLIRRAIEGLRHKVQLSVKFGALRGPDGRWLGFDARPAAVKSFAAYSLKRLGVETIDVYRPARLDGAVPIEDTIGAIAELVKAGYVKHIGLSEVGAETIRRAAKVQPIVDLQIEYSIASRGPERQIFPALAEVGASATLYGVYSRGLLTGSKAGAGGDSRGFFPRFHPDNRAQNDAAVDRIRVFASEGGRTPAQLLLGWALAKQPALVPVVGARTRAQVDDALAALDRPLTADEVAELERMLPSEAIAGTRYATEQMNHLDSERS